jgi:hypothetical protein
MSKLVIFSVLGATLLACEPAKSPSTDGGDASTTVVVVDAGKVSVAPAPAAAPAGAPAPVDAGKK